MRILPVAVLVAALGSSACGGKSKESTEPPPRLPDDETTATTEPAEPAPAPTPAPAPNQLSPEEASQVADRIVVLMTELGTAVAAAGEDCKAATAAIQAWLDQHSDEVAALDAKGSQIPPQYAQENLQAQFVAINAEQQKVAVVASKCQDDPSFKALQEKLGGPPPPPAP